MIEQDLRKWKHLSLFAVFNIKKYMFLSFLLPSLGTFNSRFTICFQDNFFFLATLIVGVQSLSPLLIYTRCKLLVALG